MLPDPGRYQERYRLTGSAVLGLAASLLAVGLGVLGHTTASFMIAAAVGFLAALAPAGDVFRVARRGSPSAPIMRALPWVLCRAS